MEYCAVHAGDLQGKSATLHTDRQTDLPCPGFSDKFSGGANQCFEKRRGGGGGVVVGRS